ncbi:glycoside hydrolase family 5 protein [Kitasatospora phosalacinea]|uniref:glycoside hydrolase family 5 protein n=1 Tax=Kitasatospora phosalacinea TaxID=2065 RepID=UPI00364BCD16
MSESSSFDTTAPARSGPGTVSRAGRPLLRFALVAALLAVAATLGTARAHPEGAPAPALRAQGAAIVDSGGRPVALRGVNRVGGEYACVQGWGLWDGPTDDASVAAMREWRVNAVRLPLNEDCWNGAPGVPAEFSGPAYARAVREYADRLQRHGITPVLSLLWGTGRYTGPSSACPDERALCLKPMPDEGAVRFWSTLARAFPERTVLFDLYNEPFPDRAMDPETAWRCWREGADACAAGIPGYRAVGLQTLVDAVRATGAENLLLVAPQRWANDLSGWARHHPEDPRRNLAVSWHAYPTNSIAAQACWNSVVAPVAAAWPLVATELGEYDCAGAFVRGAARWLDRNGADGYLAWTWSTGDCASRPSLITDFAGHPTPYGAAWREQLADAPPP